VQAAGNWTVSRALGANFNLSAWGATSPYHRITLFSRLDLPTGRENEIRAKYYPVPPGLKPADRQAHDEAYSAEYKRARQDAGRTLVQLLGDATLAFGPLLNGAGRDDTAY